MIDSIVPYDEYKQKNFLFYKIGPILFYLLKRLNHKKIKFLSVKFS
jgi:hypothetical protein